MRRTSRSPRTMSAVAVAVSVLAVAGCSSTGTSAGAASASSSPAASASAGSASPSRVAGSGAASGTIAAGGGLGSVPGIVQDVEPSVVTITTGAGLGSGVVYRSDGTIVTDAHVVENQQHQPFKQVKVAFADGKKVTAKVVGVDDVTDVAVIKASRGNLPAAQFASALPQVGELAVVIGSPLGLTETVTAGIISAVHRDIPPSQESPQGLFNLIQTDAPISPGNSGGAVVNAKRQVIGLSEAYLPPSTGAVAIGFVTPASVVTNVADQLLKNGRVSHAYLGLVPTDITPQVAQRFNLPTTSGALVLDVASGGPAARAGFQSGDVITKFDGTNIGSVTDLLRALRNRQPGQTVAVQVRRGQSTTTLHVTLANRPTGS